MHSNEHTITKKKKNNKEESTETMSIFIENSIEFYVKNETKMCELDANCIPNRVCSKYSTEREREKPRETIGA